MNSELSEAEISMILDTYMYMNYKDAADGITMAEAVAEMPLKTDVEGRYHNEYAILKQAVEEPQIGTLKIKCQSFEMGYNEGTNATTFVNEAKNKTYISFRGTYDGEWLDNGLGLVDAETTQQKEAVAYFDEVVETLGLTEGDEVYLGAHSKGGNKVQYITMESENSDVITATYSIDGQGHSPKAIKKWKEKLGEEEYQKRVSKLYGINGQNDFVSVLGNCIIPASHISYVETPSKIRDFVGYHDITRMFAVETVNNDGGVTYEYKGRVNRNVLKRGELGDYVSRLSESIMLMPSHIRKGCTKTIMQICEVANKGNPVGINKEHMSLENLLIFKRFGMATILETLLFEPEGKECVKKLFGQEPFASRNSLAFELEVNYKAMDTLGDLLLGESATLNIATEELEAAGMLIPLVFEGYSFRKPHIDNCAVKLKMLVLKLGKLGMVQKQAASLYEKFDSTSLM